MKKIMTICVLTAVYVPSMNGAEEETSRRIMPPKIEEHIIRVEGIDDQTLLAEIARNDENFYARSTAVRKLTDQAVLTEIATKESEETYIRRMVMERLHTPRAGHLFGTTCANGVTCNETTVISALICWGLFYPLLAAGVKTWVVSSHPPHIPRQSSVCCSIPVCAVPLRKCLIQ